MSDGGEISSHSSGEDGGTPYGKVFASPVRDVLVATLSVIAGAVLGWALPTLKDCAGCSYKNELIVLIVLASVSLATGMIVIYLSYAGFEALRFTTKHTNDRLFAFEDRVEEMVKYQAKVLTRDQAYGAMKESVDCAKKQVVLLATLFFDWNAKRRTYTTATQFSKNRESLFESLFAAIKRPDIEYIRIFQLPRERHNEFEQVLDDDALYRKEVELISAIQQEHPERARLSLSEECTNMSLVLIDHKHLFINIDIYDSEQGTFRSPYVVFIQDATEVTFLGLDSLITQITSRVYHSNQNVGKILKRMMLRSMRDISDPIRKDMPVSILFIGSDQSAIDRSWFSRDARSALEAAGFETAAEVINTTEALNELFPRYEGALVWPTAYTLGSEADAPSLIGLFEAKGISYIGWPSKDLELNSKVALKERLKHAGILTPPFVLSSQSTNSLDLPFGYPVVVKAEHSSTSVGVAVADGPDQLRAALKANSEKYGQVSVIEKWCRHREYTLAVLRADDDYLIAPLELVLHTNRTRIVDTSIKVRYEGLEISLPTPAVRARLTGACREVLRTMATGDYLRIDILEDVQGNLYFIDFNFLPGMDSDSDCPSFFPMALNLNFGFSYEMCVTSIVRAALLRQGRAFPAEIEKVTQATQLSQKR